MTIDKLITLLRDYHGQDEVVAMTQKGRLLILDRIDLDETINLGKVVIRTEWAVKASGEELPERNTEDITPDEERPHFARVVCTDRNKALRLHPWTVATVRMVDGWMCFDSEREMNKWLRKNVGNPEVNKYAPRDKRIVYRDPNRPKGKIGRPKKNKI